MKKLTKAEEEVMQVLWDKGRCTVKDIREAIDPVNPPPHSTISTFVRILEEKGFVDHKAYGRTYEYFPLVSKEAYSSDSLDQLAQDYFGGSMRKLVSFLVQEEKLDRDELNDLLQQLENDEKPTP